VDLAAVGGLAQIAAGVLGTAATWVASTGSRSAGGEAQTPRLAGACERQVRVFFGGARCAASPLAFERPLQKKKIGRELRKAGADRGTVDGHGWGRHYVLQHRRGAAGSQPCHSRVQH
jgi:hypothetical protein